MAQRFFYNARHNSIRGFQTVVIPLFKGSKERVRSNHRSPQNQPNTFFYYVFLFLGKEFYKTLHYPKCTYRVKANQGEYHKPWIEQYAQGLIRLAIQPEIYPCVLENMSLWQRSPDFI
ncbi:MAG: hypothetical protein ACOC4M_15785 [Promethearchaeia archaeon]